MSGSKRAGGGLLILFASLLGAVFAARDYITPSTGIDHSYGVLLVLASNALMMLGALAILILGSGVVVNISMFLVLLDILGTGFAAYMLESELIIATTAIAAVGWLLKIVGVRGIS